MRCCTEGLQTIAVPECSEEMPLQQKTPGWLQTLLNIGIVPAGSSAVLPSLRVS